MSRLVNGSRGRVRCGAVGTLLWLSWYSSGRAWGNSSIGAALESKNTGKGEGGSRETG